MLNAQATGQSNFHGISYVAIGAGVNPQDRNFMSPGNDTTPPQYRRESGPCRRR